MGPWKILRIRTLCGRGNAAPRKRLFDGNVLHSAKKRSKHIIHFHVLSAGLDVAVSCSASCRHTQPHMDTPHLSLSGHLKLSSVDLEITLLIYAAKRWVVQTRSLITCFCFCPTCSLTPCLYYLFLLACHLDFLLSRLLVSLSLSLSLSLSVALFPPTRHKLYTLAVAKH